MEKTITEHKYLCRECFFFTFPIRDNPCNNCVQNIQKRVNNYRKHQKI